MILTRQFLVTSFLEHAGASPLLSLLSAKSHVQKRNHRLDFYRTSIAPADTIGIENCLLVLAEDVYHVAVDVQKLVHCIPPIVSAIL